VQRETVNAIAKLTRQQRQLVHVYMTWLSPALQQERARAQQERARYHTTKAAERRGSRARRRVQEQHRGGRLLHLPLAIDEQLRRGQQQYHHER
jgi:hypothetical protein